jgi:hypothetical protein
MFLRARSRSAFTSVRKGFELAFFFFIVGPLRGKWPVTTAHPERPANYS